MEKEKKELLDTEQTKEMKEKLEDMLREVTLYKISAKKYKAYYNLLNSAIELGLADEFRYLFALSVAIIIDESEETEKIRKDLCAKAAKSFIKSKDDIIASAEEIKKKINPAYTLNELPTNCKWRLSYDEFCYYCSELMGAYFSHSEKIDIKKYAKSLLNVVIDDSDSYDQDRFNYFNGFLECMINEPEKETSINTESASKEKKELLDTELTREIKERLENMRKDVMMNRIPVKAFKAYYALLKKATELKLIKSPLPYLLALSNAVVERTVKDEFEEVQRIFGELNDKIAETIRESMGDKINVLYTLNEIPTNSRLSFKQFCNYCDKLRLATTTKFDGINIKESAQKLFNAKVDDLIGYDSHKKYNDYCQFLASIINEPKKGKRR